MNFETKLNSAGLDPEKDIKFVLDKMYYTFSGLKKMTGLKDNSLRNEVKYGKIRVFKYPACDLFSLEAIQEWVINNTVEPEMGRKKKKGRRWPSQ